MPLGKNRTDLNTTGISYLNGTPVTLPLNVGNPARTDFGNPVPNEPLFTKISTVGGTTAYKWYYSFPLPGAGQNWQFSVSIYNEGPNTVHLGTNYAPISALVAPGVYTNLVVNFTTNGVSLPQFLFYTALSTDSMNIVVANPFGGLVGGQNQFPVAAQTFIPASAPGGWVAGDPTSQTTVVTQGYNPVTSLPSPTQFGNIFTPANFAGLSLLLQESGVTGSNQFLLEDGSGVILLEM